MVGAKIPRGARFYKFTEASLVPILAKLKQTDEDNSVSDQWKAKISRIAGKVEILAVLKELLPVQRLSFVVDGDETFYFGENGTWRTTKTKPFFMRLIGSLYNASGLTEHGDAFLKPTASLGNNLFSIITDPNQPWSLNETRGRFRNRFADRVPFAGPFLHPYEIICPIGRVNLMRRALVEVRAEHFHSSDWNVSVSFSFGY